MSAVISLLLSCADRCKPSSVNQGATKKKPGPQSKRHKEKRSTIGRTEQGGDGFGANEFEHVLQQHKAAA
jgi:hypothetical protein